MKVVNLTPHTITVRNNRGEMSFSPSGLVARVEILNSDECVNAFHADNGKETFDPGFEYLYIEVGLREYGELINCPEPEHGTVYIVSNPCLEHSKRLDIFAPDTGPTAYRDENGQAIAVSRLLGNKTGSLGRFKTLLK